jgi:small GTP-binding protein
MQTPNKLRNIGIFAHVDAGKTSLSEQLLAHAGAIRQVGSVDSGTAHTDNLDVERRRGISVKATCARFEWKGVQVNLIDTPGHVDFSAEVERSLWALDAAVLVVCAVEGVQPQTEALFQAMKEQGVPMIFFLNKTDREGADPARVLAQIRRLLSSEAAPLYDMDELAETVCATDDDLLEKYLSGESFPPEFLRDACKAARLQGGNGFLQCIQVRRDDSAAIGHIRPFRDGRGPFRQFRGIGPRADIQPRARHHPEAIGVKAHLQ